MVGGISLSLSVTLFFATERTPRNSYSFRCLFSPWRVGRAVEKEKFSVDGHRGQRKDKVERRWVALLDIVLLALNRAVRNAAPKQFHWNKRVVIQFISNLVLTESSRLSRRYTDDAHRWLCDSRGNAKYARVSCTPFSRPSVRRFVCS